MDQFIPFIKSYETEKGKTAGWSQHKDERETEREKRENQVRKWTGNQDHVDAMCFFLHQIYSRCTFRRQSLILPEK